MAALRDIPQCDPRAAYLAQGERIDAAIHRVLHQGRYILGPEVAAFESEFAQFLGAGHALGVANGTDALTIALRALGIGPGDAVITVSHTAVATAMAIRSTGAIPLFVDVDAAHGLMDPHQVQALLQAASRGKTCVARDRIRAIVPVHLYGRCADMAALCSIAGENALEIVEDCAQAHGARIAGRAAGTFGAIGTFSFYPTKNLGAIGDGGALVTSNAALHERARLLREYGWRERYISELEGGNSRLDELQAAILRIKLPRLDADNSARAAIADVYRSAIRKSGVALPPAAEPARHVYHQFAIRCSERDSLQRYLREKGIGALVHYPRPVHLQPAYANPEFAPLPLRETERWASEVLSLPMFPQLSEQDALHVASILNDSPTILA